VARVWNDGHRFSGRVVLVTGAGGTLGGAIARGFGGEGASVVVGYRKSQAAAESVAAEIAAAGGSARGAQLDVTDQASVDRFAAEAAALYGRIDVLVNTAGRIDEADTARFEDMSPDAATALLMVDVVGSMRMCHAVIPYMRRNGSGAIINFSSTYGNGVTQRTRSTGSRSPTAPPRARSEGSRPLWHETSHPTSASTRSPLAPSPGTGSRSGASTPNTSRKPRR
jgi:NAD(P)-dependent dehydrogenase (short-subunit alcohol dehydrogenase family)